MANVLMELQESLRELRDTEQRFSASGEYERAKVAKEEHNQLMKAAEHLIETAEAKTPPSFFEWLTGSKSPFSSINSLTDRFSAIRRIEQEALADRDHNTLRQVNEEHSRLLLDLKHLVACAQATTPSSFFAVASTQSCGSTEWYITPPRQNRMVGHVSTFSIATAMVFCGFGGALVSAAVPLFFLPACAASVAPGNEAQVALVGTSVFAAGALFAREPTARRMATAHGDSPARMPAPVASRSARAPQRVVGRLARSPLPRAQPTLGCTSTPRATSAE